ncbi:hypothetical protein GCK32_014021, partial [Trichostrongylus colubriformis]
WQNIQGNASTGWYDITCSVGAPFSTVDKINDPLPTCVTKYKMGYVLDNRWLGQHYSSASDSHDAQANPEMR